MFTSDVSVWIQPILLFACGTACRRGEILALPWADVDLENHIARISQSLEQTKAGLRVKAPKNGRPRRVYLPASLVTALREHQERQKHVRQLFGDDYQVSLDLVFAAPDGGYLTPDSVIATACLIAREAGLQGIGLHSLRHSHGSQLLSKGVPLPAVSKRLGHSSPNITATVYAHAFDADESAAARIWDQSVGAFLQDTIHEDSADESVAECSKIGSELLLGKELSGNANGNRTRYHLRNANL
jgi:integrase